MYITCSFRFGDLGGISSTEGVKLIVDFDHEQTATIQERDIVKPE
jgi:hypothetical protein